MSAKKPINSEKDKLLDIPPTFYDKIGDNLTLDLTKLIDLVIKRYKLLKQIESAPEDDIKNKETKNIKKIINIPQELKWDTEENINNDIASHFLLALIMCKNEQDIRWFIRQESSLYKSRIEPKPVKDPVTNKFLYWKIQYNMYKILSSLGMNLTLYEPKKNPEVDINKICFNHKEKINNEKIYFCRFEDAINLIAKKEYFLYKGNVYILETDLPKLFKVVFEQKQEKVMAKIRANSETIKSDRRIKEIITSFEREKEILNNQEAAKLAKEIPNDEKLRTLQDVDIFSEKCFPLCMNLIQRHINKYSHLMHFGRLQYTLFLKGAGLPVDEALKFFQKKYEKKTPLDKFEKEYAYNIRHSYGLEGKRMNYNPFNCEKILNMNAPMGQECHGCPFKNYSYDNLKKILETCNLKDEDVAIILDKKKNSEFQLACVKYFEGKFPKVLGEGIGIHPNKYFTSAMRSMKGFNNKKNGNNSGEFNINNNDINNIEEIIDNNDNKMDIDS